MTVRKATVALATRPPLERTSPKFEVVTNERFDVFFGLDGEDAELALRLCGCTDEGLSRRLSEVGECLVFPGCFKGEKRERLMRWAMRWPWLCSRRLVDAVEAG